MDLIGVVDTMFARYDMGAEALDELSECPGYGTQFTTLRRTVPGFKDLAVAAKKMIEEDGCRIVVALGMPGKEKVDKVCAHEASTGIMTAQLMTNTPILEVFVHEDESDDPAELAMVFKNRSRDHARNAYLMLYEPEQLTARAGQGIRQGFAHAGPARSVEPFDFFDPARPHDRHSRGRTAWAHVAGSQPHPCTVSGHAGGSGISRQSEDLFGDDVALDLGRAAADGQCRREQKATGPGGVGRRWVGSRRSAAVDEAPDRPQPPTGPVPASMACGPARSRAISMMCWPWASAMALRTEASAPGRPPRQDGRDHPQAQHPQDLRLYPDVDEAVTDGWGRAHRRRPGSDPRDPRPSGPSPTARPRPRATPARCPG